MTTDGNNVNDVNVEDVVIENEEGQGMEVDDAVVDGNDEEDGGDGGSSSSSTIQPKLRRHR